MVAALGVIVKGEADRWRVHTAERGATVIECVLFAVLIGLACAAGIVLDPGRWSTAVSMWSVITH
jgi:Flp pilus assembly pilin Flp